MLRAQIEQKYRAFMDRQKLLASSGASELRRGLLQLSHNDRRPQTADGGLIEIDLSETDACHPELVLLANTAVGLFEEVVAGGGQFVEKEEEKEPVKGLGRGLAGIGANGGAAAKRLESDDDDCTWGDDS